MTMAAANVGAASSVQLGLPFPLLVSLSANRDALANEIVGVIERALARVRQQTGILLNVVRALFKHAGWHSNRVWCSQEAIRAFILEFYGLDVSLVTVKRALRVLRKMHIIRVIDDPAELMAGPGPHMYPSELKTGDGPVTTYDLSAILDLLPAALVEPAAKPEEQPEQRDLPDPFAEPAESLATPVPTPAPASASTPGPLIKSTLHQKQLLHRKQDSATSADPDPPPPLPPSQYNVALNSEGTQRAEAGNRAEGAPIPGIKIDPKNNARVREGKKASNQASSCGTEAAAQQSPEAAAQAALKAAKKAETTALVKAAQAQIKGIWTGHVLNMIRDLGPLWVRKLLYYGRRCGARDGEAKPGKWYTVTYENFMLPGGSSFPNWAEDGYHREMRIEHGPPAPQTPAQSALDGASRQAQTVVAAPALATTRDPSEYDPSPEEVDAVLPEVYAAILESGNSGMLRMIRGKGQDHPAVRAAAVRFVAAKARENQAT